MSRVSLSAFLSSRTYITCAGKKAEMMLAARMEKEASKKRKSEEREKKHKQVEQVKQPEKRTRSKRVSRPPEQSYEPATIRRLFPIKVMCDVLLSSLAPNESPTDIHFILCIWLCCLLSFSKNTETQMNWKHVQGIAWTSNLSTDQSKGDV